MCGISGYADPVSIDHLGWEPIKAMVGALAHRGPDETGFYVDCRAALGHARLSVVDLDTGTQPLHNEKMTLWIVCNGEIFNHPELRQTLIEKGHRFHSRSDTEVILHLYEEAGPACLERLNGQFALAIWDRTRNTLFLARDRMGIRPLFYTHIGNTFCFASEIKALFTLPGVSRQLAPRVLDQVFTFWSPLPGDTLFEGIHALPPGHWLLISPEGTQMRRYWELHFAGPDAYLGNPVEDLCEELTHLMADAVKIRMRADIPVAAYVSGGIDSSVITALAGDYTQRPISSYGIRFEETAFDEGVFQREAADFFHTDHHERIVDNRTIDAHFRAVVRSCETPLLRTAPVPMYLLAQSVRDDGVRVVLTGEGGDEVFGGYHIFKEAKIRRFWARRSESRFRWRLLSRLYPYVFKDRASARALRLTFGADLESSGEPFFSHDIRWRRTLVLKRFLSEEMHQAIGEYSGIDVLKAALPSDFDAWDIISKAQFLEMKTFMGEYLLASQGDRVAMAHGIETRMPFLDHRVHQFMSRVPPKFKLQGLTEKYLMRRAFSHRLPAGIRIRGKNPFRAPMLPTLRKTDPAVSGMEFLSEAALKRADLFDPAKVAGLLRKSREADQMGEFDQMALVGIFSAQILYHDFIEDISWINNTMAPVRLWVDHRSSKVHGQ